MQTSQHTGLSNRRTVCPKNVGEGGGCDQGRWDSGLIGMERQTNKFDKPGLSTKIYSIIIKSRRKREKQKKQEGTGCKIRKTAKSS